MSQPSQSYLIGAAPDCEIRLGQAEVSAHHARLTLAGGAWLLEDLHSTNGVFVNGQRITTCHVDMNSQIVLGGYPTTLAQLLTLAQQPPAPPAPGPHSPQRTGPPDGQGVVEEYSVGSRMLLIGRDEQCDIPIAESRVSTRHARVFRNAGRLIIEDGGSANGTFVNGERIAWKILTADDVVQVGSRRMRFRREPRPSPDAPPRASMCEVSRSTSPTARRASRSES